MIFFLSFLVWMMVSTSLNIENLIFAVIAASFSWYVGSKVIPTGSAIGVIKVILFNIPKAIMQAFKMLFSTQVFSTSETPSPKNRMEEFGKIVSITLTPEELVIFKEDNILVIHEVRKR